MSVAARRENFVLPDLILPNRSLYYTKTMQGECSSKTGKLCFTGLDTAEPQLALYKDNANERKESLLFISRVQLALCKDKKNGLQRQYNHIIL
ncbi:hypothetical protein [Leyella lascolaii]|uniref:Uncharacterized protein n=1 Tax=Leyella lascolaii TaxID=1776379 RepID=A0AAW7JH11_9BACT|nr:hypothetical protein [Leyella lascolaii]MDN0022067.1 hypothetical protein [Leyella lascolaii]MDN0024540.1 hypothetical protein [Leyella lascolaii]